MRETPNQSFFLQNSHYKVKYKLYLTNCWSDKLLTTTIVISTSKKLNVQTFKWFWAVLPGQKQLCFCIVKEKYGFQIGNAMDKNKLHFDQGEMLKIAWYSTHVGFWICWFQWHRFWSCTFRHFWVMGYMYALSWKLLIIDLLLVCYATLLKRLHLKKLAAKCSIFLHQLDFFSYVKVKDAFCSVWIRIKFHLGKTKGRGKRGYGGEPKIRWGFFAKYPVLSEIQTYLRTVGQTNF